jgi:hypothetical protein
VARAEREQCGPRGGSGVGHDEKQKVSDEASPPWSRT